MNVPEQVKAFIASQAEPKREEMQTLHYRILQVSPEAKLWFFDGTNEEGKIVSNPTIGYGLYTIKYANGTNRDFFQVGLSPNKTGISVHIMGIADKTYLNQTFGKDLGKASISGYCIKFKTLKDIDLNVLVTAIQYGFAGPHEQKIK